VLIPTIRAVEPNAEAPESTAPDRALEGLTILVVDDEAMVLDLMTETLEDFGATVEAFSDGKAALEALEVDPDRFDRVVVDQTMPGLSGLEVRARIHEQARSVRVVIVSGFADLHLSEDEYTAFLSKPFTIDELVNAVRGG